MLKYRNAFLLALFSAGFLRTFFRPASLVDASILLIVGAVFAYIEYKNQDKRVSALEEKLNKQNAEVMDLKDKVSSLRVIQQAKPGSLAFRS